ncbi:hypothetical protein CTM88_18035 [Photobacterium aquimaris]|uniref:Uncharacterized protein n=1 Tax=Photobacterium aquimaris TaxID=512643 RepID=A0A2T3IFQ6_9GAMM|nr:hypothetical protein [Photobacterium aquimaris]OBU22029.1 hypothetical protein AYY20_12615 [Photobacterium aquimaris]PSU25111.1 hypothetical protein CTM88_18035 [Photobacterium aquimaris]
MVTTVNNSAAAIIVKLNVHICADEPGDVRTILDEVCTAPTQEIIDEVIASLKTTMPLYEFSYCRDNGWGFNDLSSVNNL